MGREKNVGRVDDWAIHRANIFPCFGNKDRRFEDRNLELFARGIFILYTNII